MTTPELPALRRYDFIIHGRGNAMVRSDAGEYCDNDDREARERILTQRVAELEADAERYRYLRREGAWQQHSLYVRGSVSAIFVSDGCVGHATEGARLDAAIDAARGAK